jgi:hypothetical protein
MVSIPVKNKPKGYLTFARRTYYIILDQVDGKIIHKYFLTDKYIQSISISSDGVVLTLYESDNVRKQWKFDGKTYNLIVTDELTVDVQENEDKNDIILVSSDQKSMNVNDKLMRPWNLKTELPNQIMLVSPNDDEDNYTYLITSPLADEIISLYYCETSGYLFCMSSYNLYSIEFQCNRVPIKLNLLLSTFRKEC